MTAMKLHLVEKKTSPRATQPGRTRAKKIETNQSASERPDERSPDRSAAIAPKTSRAKTVKREATADDIMSRPAICCRAEDTLNDAARLMWEHDFGAVVVVDETSRPVSMITDRDIAMACYTQGLPLFLSPVRSAMARRLVQCQLSTPIAEIRELMVEARVRRVPVVDDSGRVQGVVGFSDIFKEAQAKLPADRKRGSSSAMLVQLASAIVGA